VLIPTSVVTKPLRHTFRAAGVASGVPCVGPAGGREDDCSHWQHATGEPDNSFASGEPLASHPLMVDASYAMLWLLYIYETNSCVTATLVAPKAVFGASLR